MDNTCRNDNVATKTLRLEILNFRHFYRHVVFTGEGEKIRNKEIRDYFNVSVVIDLDCGNMSESESEIEE